jgi:hypothetical protein
MSKIFRDTFCDWERENEMVIEFETGLGEMSAKNVSPKTTDLPIVLLIPLQILEQRSMHLVL